VDRGGEGTFLRHLNITSLNNLPHNEKENKRNKNVCVGRSLKMRDCFNIHVFWF
jgi:hypothetical protein